MDAFQDPMTDNLCFGCGPGNDHGLRIKSTWSGDEAVCTYRPQPHQMAGPPQFLNGGIIATLIDCHCVCTAMAHLYRAEGRAIGSQPTIWCVTGRLEVRYLRPTPIDRPVELRARVVEAAGKKVTLRCTLTSGGEPTAEGEVVAIHVPESWRRATP